MNQPASFLGCTAPHSDYCCLQHACRTKRFPRGKWCQNCLDMFPEQ